jgi:Protein of unknown function (DUF3025)
MLDDLKRINWGAPWLATYRALGLRVSAACEGTPNLATALNQTAAEHGLDVPHFVEQSALPPDEAYEAFIFSTGSVPTRDNLHDFFNGLVWLHEPKLKRRLNELQAAEIERHGVQAERGAVRDALTLFDENAALLSAPPMLWQALKDKDWQRLFVEHRGLWSEAKLQIFGHALLEKLVTPRKAHTAHVWCAGPNLSAPSFARKAFAPLPVLGVPGWCADNEHLEFYQDARVFRPPSAPSVSAQV